MIGSWFRQAFRRSARARRALAPVRFRPRLQRLEDRTLLSVTLVQGIDGINSDYGPATQVEPPDTSAAAGPSYVVEAVNSQISYFDKTTGAQAFTSSLYNFFAPADPNSPFMSDTWVSYDTQAQRFFVSTLSIQFNGSNVSASYYDLAVSNDSNPLDGWSEMQKIRTDEPAPGVAGVQVWTDYPRIGWNKDAFVVTFNLFDENGADPNTYGVEVLTIQKSTLLDQNPATLNYLVNNRDSSNFTLMPATMQDDGTGGTMWLTDEAALQPDGTYDQLRVVKETYDWNAQAATFTDYYVNIAPYEPLYNVPEDSEFPITYNIDTRVFSADMANNMMVVAQNVNVAGDGNCHARWTEFNMTGGNPTLYQQGTIGVGSGSDSFYPSVAIAPDGTIGMTYMQSSFIHQQNMSMYVTGRAPTDPLNTMQAGKEARAGLDVYYGFRAGDFSEITVDPSGTSFWAANEYARSAPDFFPHWGTWLENFQVIPSPHIVITVPKVVTANQIFSITLTVENYDNTIDTGYRGVVDFSSSDLQAILPSEYQFTAADDGIHTFTVRLRTAGVQTIIANDATNSISGTAPVSVNPGPVATFRPMISNPVAPGNPFQLNATAGVPFTLLVDATDAFGNVVSNYTGTVHFSSSDTSAALPANYHFSVGNNGVATFHLTLYREFLQTVTITDINNHWSTNTVGINVVAGPEAGFRLTIASTGRAVVPLNLTVAAVDRYGNVVTGFQEGVYFSSTDPRAVLPYGYEFTPADKGQHQFAGGVIFDTVGKQTLTASEYMLYYDGVNSPVTGKATVQVSAGPPGSVLHLVQPAHSGPMFPPLLHPPVTGGTINATNGSSGSSGGSATPAISSGPGTNQNSPDTSQIDLSVFHAIPHLATLGTWGNGPAETGDGDAGFWNYLQSLLNGTPWASLGEFKSE